MQTELSEVLAESGVRTFTTAQRKFWLNRGVVDVCRKTLCLKKVVTKNVVAAQRVYFISAGGAASNDWVLNDYLDFAEEGLLYDDNNASANSRRIDPLERKTVEWLDDNVPGWRVIGTSNQSDSLAYYVRYGLNQVYIQPVPKTAVTGGWIINYYYYPISTVVGGLVSGTDVPFDGVAWLEPYHNLPVLFAGYRALLKAGSLKKNDVWAEYTAGIKEVLGMLRGAPDYQPKIRVYNYRAR